MKRLILLRHAKSSWKDERAADIERPLAERGKRDAPRMGKRLKAREVRPDLMLTSRAKRALQTAKLVAEELGYRRDDLAIDDSLYLAAPERILAVVAKQDDSVESLLVVGHNPGLTELVNDLVPELGVDNLPTTGVVAVDFEVERWRDVASAAAKLAFYDYPANPEPVRGES